MVQQYNNTPPREGLEALESDIEFYNMLIDQQRDGDSLLSRFNIVLSAHYEDYDAEEVNTFDFSVPVGISYEYMNVCLDARYNIGVSKIADGDAGRNSVFQITLGYKFKL